MNNVAYDGNIILSKPPQYTCNLGKGAAGMMKKRKKESDYNNMQVIHIVPKMDEMDREKAKKTVSNELYEIFLRIQTQLRSDNEIANS